MGSKLDKIKSPVKTRIKMLDYHYLKWAMKMGHEFKSYSHREYDTVKDDKGNLLISETHWYWCIHCGAPLRITDRVPNSRYTKEAEGAFEYFCKNHHLPLEPFDNTHFAKKIKEKKNKQKQRIKQRLQELEKIYGI